MIISDTQHLTVSPKIICGAVKLAVRYLPPPSLIAKSSIASVTKPIASNGRVPAVAGSGNTEGWLLTAAMSGWPYPESGCASWCSLDYLTRNYARAVFNWYG